MDVANVTILDVGAAARNDVMTSSLGGNHTLRGPLTLQPYSMVHLLVTSTVLGLMILATIIGNVFVIAAIVLERNLHSVANYLIASLAVADLMVAALVMPLAAVKEVSTQWFMGPEMCDTWIFVDVLCCTSSILHLVAVALDRYWAVTRVDYIKNRSAKRILGMIALSWTMSVCISLPPLIGWKDETDAAREATVVCLISQDWAYTVFSTLGAFYVPSFFMIFIYMKIYKAAKSRIRKKRFKTSPSAGKSAPAVNTVPTSTPATPAKTPTNSGEHSDTNRNNKHIACAMESSPGLRAGGSLLDVTKGLLDKKRSSPHRKDRAKEKLEQKRERKAARTLAIITGSFISCYLPFFIIAIMRPFCGASCHYPELLLSFVLWLGYFNSLLNPIIYTIFSPDFRMAFRKILFGTYHKSRGGGRARRS
ncbi:hypothetical protein NP493_333g01017 [Ridgeia piscesae]|uniref:G-protein coupled receptors family 1 profile domain-containing protein n=1 Tax=Ridgeia piscesae TaxID=27915 RepID=A0AAD9L4S5_RIDPI|nr:hypothetical protein NP493_333g01017 [Ridgeia piscesae]